MLASLLRRFAAPAGFCIDPETKACTVPKVWSNSDRSFSCPGEWPPRGEVGNAARRWVGAQARGARLGRWGGAGLPFHPSMCQQPPHTMASCVHTRLSHLAVCSPPDHAKRDKKKLEAALKEQERANPATANCGAPPPCTWQLLGPTVGGCCGC